MADGRHGRDTRYVDLVLTAILGALATALIGPLMIASVEVRRHDRQIAERDEDLEE